MQEFNTIKDLLQSVEKQLLEAQASILESQKEIETDLADCRKALAALEPTPEDAHNLHSYLHVNNEKSLDIQEGEHDNGGFPTKKPYRIKTREEMIVGEYFVDEDENIWVSEKESGETFAIDMSYLHGRELDTNETQRIDGWLIEPWMITENK